MPLQQLQSALQREEGRVAVELKICLIRLTLGISPLCTSTPITTHLVKNTNRGIVDVVSAACTVVFRFERTQAGRAGQVAAPFVVLVDQVAGVDQVVTQTG